MSAPPYMRLYWADYHQDTRHLSRDEHGAYFLLLGEAWNRGGYLPDDDALLARWALASPAEWERLKPIVMAYFRPATKGRWRHKRISEELAAYDDVSRKRKAAGKRGGASRRGKDGENPEANAMAIAKQKPTKPEPEPEPLEEEPPRPPKGGREDLFGAEPEKRPRRKAQTPIPDDFPSALEIVEEQDKARQAGADVDAAYQADRFRNWAQGRDARYADWRATWRNWMARAVNDAPKRGVVASAAVAEPVTDQWARRIKTYRQNGYWNRLEWGPAPGRPGCTLSAEVLMAHGYMPPPAEGRAA